MKYIAAVPILFILLLFSGCMPTERPYTFRADFRFGTHYYSIFANDYGKAYVLKGHSSNYTQPFVAKDSVKSPAIRLKKAALFFKTLDRVKATPQLEPSASTTDSQRTEVYYEGHKIYDDYAWNGRFLEIFAPIIADMPKGFSPFSGSDRVK